MQSIISVKQSVIYLSIIMCLVLGTKELTIMWIIFLVVTGNVRRISRKKPYLYWIRMTGYFIVETIPLFLRTGLKNIFSLYDGGIIWVILAFSIGGMIWIHDYNINKKIPTQDKRIPRKNMIYIGDGITDVPCMKLTKDGGGVSIAVYTDKSKKIAKDLYDDGRINYLAKADYSDGSKIDMYVKKSIEMMAMDSKLKESTLEDIK